MYKICHFTSAHKSDDVRIFRKECTSLAKNPDFDVYLVARGESREENGVHVIGVGEPPASRYKRMTSFAKEIAKAAEALNADIYHFHDPELLPYGAKLAKQGKKVIFDSHENTYEQIMIKPYIPMALRSGVASFYKSMENKWIKPLEGVIFPEDDSPFEGIAKRTVCIDNTPILEELTFDKEMPEQAVHKDSREFKVCHVGSLTYERGISHLIKACYKAGVTLILAGNYSDENYQRELEQDESYKCVDYRGFANRSQVMDIYREASCGASTLLNIGQYYTAKNMPTKVYEYMAVELPIILSRNPFAEELMKEYEFAILVDPENPDEIAEAIKSLSENEEQRKKLIEAGKLAVKEKYNWAVDEARLFRLYEEVLKA